MKNYQTIIALLLASFCVLFFACSTTNTGLTEEEFGSNPPSESQLAAFHRMAPPQALALSTPSSLSDEALITPLPTPMAQGTPSSPGSPGSCIAWSVGYGVGTYMAYLSQGWDINDPNHQVSPAYLYEYALNLEGKACPVGTDDGDYFNFLVQYGSPNLTSVPYQPTCTYLNSISLLTPSDPSLKIGSWYFVEPTDRTTIKALLASGLPLAFAGHLYSNFKDYSGDGVFYGQLPFLQNQKTGQPVGHGMVLVGYNDQMGDPTQGLGAYRIMNSFGTDWGDNGFMWMAYDSFEGSIYSTFVALPFVPFDSSLGVALTANPSGDTIPDANLVSAFQWVQEDSMNSPTVYLIFTYEFSQPFEMGTFTMTGPDSNRASNTIGHWQNNALTFFARDDGSQFPTGTYQVEIKGKTQDGTVVSYSGSINVDAPATGGESLPEQEWNESLIGGNGSRGAAE